MSNQYGNIKGSIFLYTKDYTLEVHGENVWKDLLQVLKDEDRELIDKISSESEWHPVYLMNQLFKSYDSIFGNGDFSSIIPIAEYIAKKDLEPVFNMFENLKKPIFVLQNTPSLWNRYYDTGKVEIELADEENKHYRLSLDEGTDESRFSGRATCEFATTAWIKTALEIVGAANIKTAHTKCRFDGLPKCITDIYWE